MSDRDNLADEVKLKNHPDDTYKLAVIRLISQRAGAKKEREQKHLREKLTEHHTEKLFTDADKTYLSRKMKQMKEQDEHREQQADDLGKEVADQFVDGGWIKHTEN